MAAGRVAIHPGAVYCPGMPKTTLAVRADEKPWTAAEKKAVRTELEDDLVASLVASRAGGARVRRIWVTTTQAEIKADRDTRLVEAVRTTQTTGRHEAIAQRIVLPFEDATVAQAAAFLRSVERRTSPEVGIGQAIAVQEAALAIVKRIELIAHRPALRRGPQAA